jgi:hypothetical protein
MGDGTMKERASGQKAPSSAVQVSNLGATAGAKGVALAPPTYGADSANYERLNEGPPGLVQVNRSIQAKASTTGQDVFFRPPLLQHVATEAPRTAGLIQAHGNPGGQRQNPTVAQHPNQTGLPDNLKTGIESLSGVSLDNVKVHYNSAQPSQLNALAYAQGSDIHLAPGQERHLPHEAWHVVQQAQGRVLPTMQMKDGVPVNDDQGLEREADVMGREASAQRLNQSRGHATLKSPKGGPAAQRVVKDDEEILPPTKSAPATYGALYEQVGSLNAVITIKKETDKDALGSFAEDSDGKNGTVYLWPYKDAYSLDEKNERIATATHEFQHAIDYFVTGIRSIPVRGNTDEKVRRNAALKRIMVKEQGVTEDVAVERIKEQREAIMRTEWMAWAAEAATFCELAAKGQSMKVQDIKLASEFFKGTEDVLLSEDAEFWARTEKYYLADVKTIVPHDPRKTVMDFVASKREWLQAALTRFQELTVGLDRTKMETALKDRVPKQQSKVRQGGALSKAMASINK